MKAQSEQRISLRCIDANDTSNPLNGKIINLIIWKYSENGGNFLASNYTESVIYFAYKNGSAFNGWYSFSDDATVIKSSFEITKTESYTGDCNEITNSGLFDQVINPSATNSPGQYAYIIVYKATHFNMITQIAVPCNVDGTLKVRTRENGIWRDWRTL